MCKGTNLQAILMQHQTTTNNKQRQRQQTPRNNPTEDKKKLNQSKKKEMRQRIQQEGIWNERKKDNGIPMQLSNLTKI